MNLNRVLLDSICFTQVLNKDNSRWTLCRGCGKNGQWICVYVSTPRDVWHVENSKSDCKCLIWLKYPCILTSLASSSPFTWLTTNLEFENISTAFPPIFCIVAIPCNKASYSTSFFVAENPSLNDFSMIIFSEDIKTSPTPDPLWFAAPSTYTFQHEGPCTEIVPIDFPSKFCSSVTISIGGLTNSAIKSVRT